MIDAHTALVLAYAGLLAFAVGTYVVLDGFDLGLGILFFWIRDDAQRDHMVHSIAPFWDGNETWLVFGAAILLSAFPLSFSILMPAVYVPITVMLLGLIFRGVAFEFRFKHHPRWRAWDVAFSAGSIVATFAQGIVLGTFVQGVPVEAGRYAGSAWAWATPFALLTGAALVVGYALLGATWLVWRTHGDLPGAARRLVPKLLVGLLAGIGMVSLWTPFLSPAIAERWFDFPRAFAFAPVPLLTLGCAWGVLRANRAGRGSAAFTFAVALFFLAYSGLAISVFPGLPPPSVSLLDAAAPASSLLFLLPGVALLVPLIVWHTWRNYRTFTLGPDFKGYDAH